jgi:Fe-S cluster biogenesis protein NfuA
MAINTDPGVEYILSNVQTIVASEGGSIEFVALDDGKLTVRYNKGVNEECPECVPDHDLVKQMMQTSISVYAPYITEVELL